MDIEKQKDELYLKLLNTMKKRTDMYFVKGAIYSNIYVGNKGFVKLNT